MEEFFSQFSFLKTNQAIVVPEKREIYVREKDLDLETLHKLQLKVTTCEKDIESKSTKISNINSKVKEHKRAIKDLGPTNPQATQLKSKAISLMQDAKRIEAEITRRKQTKVTLEKQIANFEQVREAQDIQRLLKESNIRMQIALGEMDTSEVAAIGKETRKADRSANKVSDTLLNPFGEDVNELDSELASAFDALELSDENDSIIQEDTSYLPPSQVRTNKPVLTNAQQPAKRREQHDVLDDLF